MPVDRATMSNETSTILILHRDAGVRTRAAKMLAPRHVVCRSVGHARKWAPGLVRQDVAVVLLQITADDRDSAAETIAHLSQLAPGAGIIGLVPAGNVALARAVFRAGARDCLEVPLDEIQLVRAVAEAVQSKSPAAPAVTAGDDLTLLTGHSAFLNSLAGLRCLCRRHGEPLAVMMLDLDRFRDCNDRHSPAFGDQVLRWFAAILESVRRRSDIAARYQSDRFIVALPGSRAPQARQVARRCRERMRANPVVHDGEEFKITVSIGIAESTVGFIETEQQLIRRARIALGHAKRCGGRRTTVWDELTGASDPRKDVLQHSAQDVSRWMERVRQQLRCTCVESTRALVAAVEAKDPCTRAHSLTVATYAETIAKRMKLRPPLLRTIRRAALLHDVGKIGVPDAILTKPARLTPREFDVVKRHPETALDIVGHASFLTEERPLILHHHERYDGQGYPAGLGGDRIPLGARVLAMADALDAMFSPRSYKPAYDLDRVRPELIAGAGRQFDPTITETTLRWLDEGAPLNSPAQAAYT